MEPFRLLARPTDDERTHVRQTLIGKEYALFQVLLHMLRTPASAMTRLRLLPPVSDDRCYREVLAVSSRLLTLAERRYAAQELCWFLYQQQTGKSLSFLHETWEQLEVGPEDDPDFRTWCQSHGLKKLNLRQVFLRFVNSGRAMTATAFADLWCGLSTTARDNLLVIWWRVISSRACS